VAPLIPDYILRNSTLANYDPIVITSGDPAGIGPEVTHKALCRLIRARRILDSRPILVIGDAHLYARHLARPAEMHKYHILPCEDTLSAMDYFLSEFHPRKGHAWRPVFLDCGHADIKRPRLGKVGRKAGERAALYLDVSIELVLNGHTDTVVTAPICKEAVHKAGFDYPGQTEFFGECLGVLEPTMMLVGGGLRVSLVTIHEPIARLPKLITQQAVTRTVTATARALAQDFGIAKPRLAVCGLNPHAGEAGHIGREEQTAIIPALKDLTRQGLNVSGPLAADSAFALARRGQFDAVVAMYHDQGLVAVKTLAFETGVNVTLGLPIVRTAPDHGTAFDIAGKMAANEGAMLEALLLAHELSQKRASPPQAGKRKAAK
jgi:4-hydroxythreonine-4-phosphate dehydrogenase